MKKKLEQIFTAPSRMFLTGPSICEVDLTVFGAQQKTRKDFSHSYPLSSAHTYKAEYILLNKFIPRTL